MNFGFGILFDAVYTKAIVFLQSIQQRVAYTKLKFSRVVYLVIDKPLPLRKPYGIYGELFYVTGKYLRLSEYISIILREK
jgi:hypothetical protein